jgi:rhodanese-related sulfurtransferase
MFFDLFKSDPAIKTISASEFADKIAKEKKPLLIDVRTGSEFKAGYIPGAQNIDIYSSDFVDKITKLDKSKAVYIYCLSGGRSKSAASLLSKQGFTEIFNLAGGISSWSGKVTR